jgi:lipoyl(octanoyl) transferase
MEKQCVVFRDLGTMEYQHAWDLQEQLLQENLRIKSAIRQKESFLADAQGADTESSSTQITVGTIDGTTNHFLLVEHPAVYTLGKSGKLSNLLIDDQQMKMSGTHFFHTNRGGDITFHGPGQIVGYPILDLENFYTDIGKYLRSLEEMIILTLSDFDIKGARSSGETGVWIDPDQKGKERKICAIGVRCSRWITMHGFALNVNTDLSYFNNIIPCGIQNKQVTSIEKETGNKVSMEDVKGRIKKRFEEVFRVELTVP